MKDSKFYKFLKSLPDMKYFRVSVVLVSLLILAAIVYSCAPKAAPLAEPTVVPTRPPATEAPPPEPTATEAAVIPETSGMALVGDMIRGGKLYDAWWTETAQDAPTENMPLFNTQSTSKTKGTSTWRCAECHGWDYKGVDGIYASGSHMTGFPGILADKGKDPAEILAALKGATNTDHDFSTVMAEQDLVDLALFVSEGTLDVDAVLEKDGTPKGNATDGQEKFGEVCFACHGDNGNAINFKTPGAVEYLAHPANENPWQFLHRMRFGIPVWPMPAAIDNEFTDQDLANVLAYTRTLTETDALASGGGLLYDKWYTVLAMNPEGDQPLWKTQTTNTRAGLSTWTCRECHGVDYLGVDGVYASGAHMTGFPGIFASASKTEEELTAALTGKTNPEHDFSTVMDEGQIAALVHFVKNEMFDITPWVMEDGITINGDKEHGKVIFDATCTQCHGDDGKMINFKTPEEPEYVGTVAADEPQVCMHRVAFGVPGFPMSSALDLGYSIQDIADACAYSQTLPVK